MMEKLREGAIDNGSSNFCFSFQWPRRGMHICRWCSAVAHACMAEHLRKQRIYPKQASGGHRLSMSYQKKRMAIYIYKYLWIDGMHTRSVYIRYSYLAAGSWFLIETDRMSHNQISSCGLVTIDKVCWHLDDTMHHGPEVSTLAQRKFAFRSFTYIVQDVDEVCRLAGHIQYCCIGVG